MIMKRNKANFIIRKSLGLYRHYGEMECYCVPLLKVDNSECVNINVSKFIYSDENCGQEA